MGDLSFLRRPRAAFFDAPTFDFVEIGRVLLTGGRIGRPWPKLGAVLEHERCDIPPSRREGKRRTRQGAVFTRFRAVGIAKIEKWRIRTISDSQGQDNGSRRT